jgi:hypothetical protein
MLSDLSSDFFDGDLIYDTGSFALGCGQILPSVSDQRLLSLAYLFFYDTRVRSPFRPHPWYRYTKTVRSQPDRTLHYCPLN